LSVLLWSLVLLMLVISIISMFTSQMLQPFMQNDANDLSARVQVYESWGTFTRSIVTMFEITLANWGPHCRLLMDNVDEWWALFFLVYKCSIGFAVVQVITSVFIQQTFKVAARDEEVMITEKKAATKAYLKNLEHLFEFLDESGDGNVSQDEFESVLRDKKVQTWFAAMEVDVTDTSKLFELLDDGDGTISRGEFIQSIKGLKGTAKGSDMLALMREARKLNRMITSVQDNLDAIHGMAPSVRPHTTVSECTPEPGLQACSSSAHDYLFKI